MNKQFYFITILFISILFGCKKSDKCHCNSTVTATDKYSYPVKAGSAEWNAAGIWGIGKFDPLDSIYKLCQVPTNTLKTMSTLGLIQSLEDNPCMVNMLLRDNKFQGRNEVLQRLNVNGVLNNRADAGIGIVNYYETKDPDCSACLNTDLEKGIFQTNWYFMDMICTQDSILNQLDKAAKKRFAKIVMDKFKIQLKYPNTFGSSRTSSILILSQLMILSSFQPYLNALNTNSNLAIFASTGILVGDFYDTVLGYSSQFINN